MTSPFPGIDPYVERHWPDARLCIIVSASTALNRRLPDDLVARCDERPAVEFGDEDRAVWFDPPKDRFIKISHATDERLITVIEFISPTNKIGKGLEQYRQKRDELIEGGVHVVEVDLVRRGDWRDLLSPHTCPRAAVATYRVTIRPGGDLHTAHLYPMPLSQPLGAFPVPLRPHDPSVMLELQPLIEQAYVSGRYGRTIDYGKPCDPPLEGDEAPWAEHLLRAAGKR